MAELLDLRGRQAVPATASVLADPSGRRMRRLAHAGRAVAAVFLLWLVGLLLAGLGILPTGDIPFGQALVGQAPPRLSVLPRPRQPSRSDLAPARPLSAAARAAAALSASGHGIRLASRGPGGQRSRSTPSGVPARGGSGVVHGGPTRSSGGRPATASPAPPPAATPQAGSGSTPGRSGSTAGRSGTRGGRSGSAPGHVSHTTTTTTSPGQSGSPPGRTVSHGNGHGGGG